MVDYATAAPGIHLEEITPAGPIEGRERVWPP